MSFILSALKKVENKRNLGSVPEISSIQIQGFDNPDNRRHRISTTLSVVSIVAVIVFSAVWFYKPLPDRDSSEQKIHSVLLTPPVIDEVIPIPEQPPRQVPTIQVPSTPPTIQTDTEPTEPYVIYNDPKLTPTPARYPPIRQSVVNTDAVSPSLYQNPTDVTQPAWEPLPVGIVNYEELPNGLRQRIPDIRLSAHIYSDLRPQARKVIINGVALREKQRLSNELSVHQINADGVIMDYQGTLFLLGKESIFN